MKVLDFESPIEELYNKIEELKRLTEEGQIDLSDEIKTIEKRAEKLRKEIFRDLSPSQIIQISRHPSRPDALSLIQLMCEEFIELHGDRVYGDDPAIVSGLGRIGGRRIAVIGHQKGHTTKENLYRNFGMPHPEGYRKALRIMEMADKFSLPILTLIDTPGAYPGKEAEERGQAEAIARNLREMAGLEVPIVSVVIGEGGSGGALGIAVSNQVFMMEYAVYSVISPEGCASILFKDAKQADIAAENLKLTAEDIVKLGVAEGIIKEPMGGAHQDWPQTAKAIRETVEKAFSEYDGKSGEEIAEERYQRFRQLGQYEEKKAPSPAKKKPK